MNLQRIINQYDPENDLIPGGPRVTWAEMELAEAVTALLDRVTKLEAKIKQMERGEPDPALAEYTETLNHWREQALDTGP